MSFKSTLQSECKWVKVLAVWRCVSVYSSRHYLALLERCLLALCICILKSRPDRSVFSHRLPLSAWVFASGKFCDYILIKFSSRLYLVKPSWDSEHVHVCQSGKCTYACCVNCICYICVIVQWFAQADLYVISSGSVADYCMPGSTLNFVCAAEPIKVPKV